MSGSSSRTNGLEDYNQNQLEMCTRISLLIAFAVLLFPSGFGQKSNKKITIKGQVVDVNRNPVSSVAILVDDLDTKKKTNMSGQYKVQVNPSAKKISIMWAPGRIIEENISDRKTVDFSLDILATGILNQSRKISEPENFEVGYGTVNKKNSPTSATNIDAKNIKYSSYTNIFDMIRSEINGVQIIGNRVYVQGISTFAGSNEALMVVDGIAVEGIEDVAPIDVRSISILKGPDASVYGMRGANGAILITTFRGADK